MKKIIDREFNRKNEAGENKYGQKIVLTYQATLNEKAAKNTGRPGFENDVRLEFSNDPDSAVRGSTGYTPWDTVVCFTYKIRSVRKLKKILQSLNISRPSGVLDIVLRYKGRKIRSEENSYYRYSNKLFQIGVFYVKVCYNHSIADCICEI